MVIKQMQSEDDKLSSGQFQARIFPELGIRACFKPAVNNAAQLNNIKTANVSQSTILHAIIGLYNDLQIYTEPTD